MSGKHVIVAFLLLIVVTLAVTGVLSLINNSSANVLQVLVIAGLSGAIVVAILAFIIRLFSQEK